MAECKTKDFFTHTQKHIFEIKFIEYIDKAKNINLHDYIFSTLIENLDKQG